MVGMCIPHFQASRYIEVDNYFSVYKINWTRDFVQCEINTADTAALFIAKISSSETERRRCNLISCPKTLISQGYSEILEAIKTRKVLSL